MTEISNPNELPLSAAILLGSLFVGALICIVCLAISELTSNKK